MVQEAAARGARLRVVTDLVFEELERAVTTGVSLPERTFDQLVNQLVRDELDRCERARELAGPRSEADIQQAVLDHQRRRARLQRALRHNDFAELEPELAPAVAAVQAVASAADLAVLRRRATRGLLGATHVNELREHGVYEPNEAQSRSLAVGDPTGRAAPPNGPPPTGTRDGAPPGAARTSPGEPPTRAPADAGGRPSPAAAETGNVVSMHARGSRADPQAVQLDDYLGDTPLDDAAIAKLKTMPLIELGKFYAEREATRDMKRKFDVVLRLLADISGNVPATQVTRRHVIEAVTLMLRMPRTHGNGPETRMGLRDLIAWADAKDEKRFHEIEGRLANGELDRKTAQDQKQRGALPRVKPKHVLNNHLRRLNAFFQWCCDHGLTHERIRVETHSISRRARLAADEQHRAVERLPWGADGLKRLFRSSVFTTPRQRQDDPLFWAPLIAVHQSTRAEEVLQLRVSDVVKEDGVWVMKLRDGYVKSHKTPASNRTVPVHDFLIALGLPELADARRAEGGEDAWLFGGIDLGHDGKFSTIFTKTFTRYRKKEGLYTRVATSIACARTSTRCWPGPGSSGPAASG